MKKIMVIMLVMFAGFALSAQDLQKLATKGAVRLFGDKDDLTSVIQLIPDGTVVEAIKADTAFTLIRLGEIEGYVRSDRLTAALPVISPAPVTPPDEYTEPAQPQSEVQQEYVPTNRYEDLAYRYGEDIGKRLYQHKVWKGVSSDMARDSWGKPVQINRMYVDQSVDEEWIYTNKYLYFRDGILIDWGPVK